MTVAGSLFELLVFPGLGFLLAAAFGYEYVDRKLYAKIQTRVGPPTIQPLADFVKLLSKETVVPESADERLFVTAPFVGFAGTATAILYVPIWTDAAALSFQGDLLIVLFLLSLPSFAVFVGGWYSQNLYGQIGSVREISLLFGYEIPFFLACLAPAIAAGTWEIAGILRYLGDNPWTLPLLGIGFVLAVLSLEAKLERTPFDIPEAGTELAEGPMADYSGRKLALFRLTRDMELVVGTALITALFLGGPYPLSSLPSPLGPVLGFLAFLAKSLLLVGVLTVIRSVTARLRLEQMLSLFYRWFVPLGLAQIIVVVGAIHVLRGF